MIEANTTYLWHTPSGVDAVVLRASDPFSFSRAQFEFGFACVSKLSAKKQYGLPSADAQVACCVTQQARVSINQQLSLSCIRSIVPRPDFRTANSFHYIHAEMGISVPVSVFFVLRNTSRPQISA